MYAEITHSEFAQLVTNGADIEIIDVREPQEYAMIRIPGSKLIPQGQLPVRMGEIDFSKPVYLVCRSGSRSGAACAWLERMGKPTTNVLGGTKSLWQDRSPAVEMTSEFVPAYFA